MTKTQRYKGTPILKSNDNKRYFSTILYPKIERKISDIYVRTTKGDRLDLLAYQYYKDSKHWWIIAQANLESIVKGSLILPTDIQLRIPTDTSDLINNFNNLNNL